MSNMSSCRLGAKHTGKQKLVDGRQAGLGTNAAVDATCYCSRIHQSRDGPNYLAVIWRRNCNVKTGADRYQSLGSAR